MKIWVTGAAGFLGRRLINSLQSTGHHVVGLSRRISPNAHHAVSLDLAGPAAVGALTKLASGTEAPDVVVHAACLKPGSHRLADYVASNVMATANLMDAFDERPPAQFVYISTLSVLTLNRLKPPPAPGGSRNDVPYLVTKRCSERMVEQFQSKTQAIVLRLPSLYGAGQSDSFIDGLSRLALDNKTIELFGRGETVRDALHVDDGVNAISACISSPPKEAFACINLGCGREVTTREYAEAVVKALNSCSRVVPVDRPSPQPVDLHADVSDARRLIGFEPTPLAASLERYAAELRA